MIEAAYLHIPFCHHICHYCDFNKVFFKNQPVMPYLEKMRDEMRHTVAKYPANQLRTIFVGGGTPTALDEKQLTYFLESIHESFPVQNVKEFTFEANPNELTAEKLRVLHAYGVDRLSIGVQTFNEKLLEKIGRVHSNQQAFQAVDEARKIGFENISLDLMYSLPGQTISDFKETLDIAFSMDVEHISAYSLIIEPKTVFYNLMNKGQLRVPSQEDEAFMYEMLMDEMEKHGYSQYEISNFARLGYESLHNLTYWDNNDYYGIGAGAHSYIDGIRRSNIAPLKKYMQTITETKSACLDEISVSKVERMEEEMFLGLRKTDGVNKANFYDKYKVEMNEVFSKPIQEYVNKGLLEETDSSLRLTKKGRFLGNEVFQAFIGGI
ncbi:coproporphyrinogen III oxidase [Priestia aryabhattai]|uniref:radical SAM family heme chaperone HemW n=1 Tax=Bacillaceae TaxID=186817 RepID=UPI000B9FDEEE|nr:MULTISPECIES: radical SAM family heme chaperone HemW [Bacillaceae]MDT2045407.1 radical SAM family heme chaperone HemW [Priestia flexa]OZT13527.1 coproporphyrinogen III oxidase [Priestia aryabhattai]TDB50836.1 oxygen-independent coproporphyrinogen III oxidase [Bacillus sp. CBEL-1]USY54530.1 radical SAM family heme chaperone HemW [Bacillus sp. 1780r2a1]